jgi:hypothetical protein
MNLPTHRSGRYLLLVLMVAGTVGALLTTAAAAPPKRATFEVSNTLTVKVPEGAQRIRIWVAVPQNDAESEVRKLTVEGPVPVQYTTDSQGNTVGYLEVKAPQEQHINIRETFTLTRTEILGVVDPAATRPITEQERATLARYLQPSTYVIINDQIKALAEQIVAGEQNPIVAARKL